MAIALDTSGSSGASGGVTSISITNITLTGSDRCLLAFAGGSQNGPTGITYAGDSLTNKDSSTINFSKTWVGFKTAPSTSANQTLTASYGASTDEAYLGYANYTGVDQTTPTGTAATKHEDPEGSPFDTTPAITVSSAAGETALGFLHFNDEGSSSTGSIDVSSPTGQTKVTSTEQLDVGDFSNAVIISKAGETSASMGATINSPFYGCSMMGFAIKPVSGGGATGKSNPISGPINGPLAGPIGM